VKKAYILLKEGDFNDPQLKRLQREISEINGLFDEWERREALEMEQKNAERVFNEKCSILEKILSNNEKSITKACKNPLPRDLEALGSLVSKHKEFENNLQLHESELKQIQNYLGALPAKKVEDQEKVDKISEKWDQIWSISFKYVERLKVVEVTLTGLEVVAETIKDCETKLSSYDKIPNDMGSLRKVLDELMTLEDEIQEKQVRISSRLLINMDWAYSKNKAYLFFKAFD